MFTRTLISRALIGLGSVVLVGGLASSGNSTNTAPTEKPAAVEINQTAEVPKPLVETKDLPIREDIPYETITQNDTNLDLGTKTTTQTGVVGVKETIYTVVYTDGTETSRAIKSVSTVKVPVNEVIHVGTKTYSAPPAKTDPTPKTSTESATPANQSTGSGYTNVDGDRIPSPTYSDSVPDGASAQCKDGTYSFSAHRQGTCSGHGGVGSWL